MVSLNSKHSVCRVCVCVCMCMCVGGWVCGCVCILFSPSEKSQWNLPLNGTFMFFSTKKWELYLDNVICVIANMYFCDMALWSVCVGVSSVGVNVTFVTGDNCSFPYQFRGHIGRSWFPCWHLVCSALLWKWKVNFREPLYEGQCHCTGYIKERKECRS